MVTKLTRLAHKIAIQLHLVAESCTMCSAHSRWLVQKLLDTPSYDATLFSVPLYNLYYMEKGKKLHLYVSEC
jgi:hypothetical protein